MLRRLKTEYHGMKCIVLKDDGCVFGTIVNTGAHGYAYNFNGTMGRASTLRSARVTLNAMGYDSQF